MAINNQKSLYTLVDMVYSSQFIGIFFTREGGGGTIIKLLGYVSRGLLKQT